MQPGEDCCCSSARYKLDVPKLTREFCGGSAGEACRGVTELQAALLPGSLDFDARILLWGSAPRSALDNSAPQLFFFFFLFPLVRASFSLWMRRIGRFFWAKDLLFSEITAIYLPDSTLVPKIHHTKSRHIFSDGRKCNRCEPLENHCLFFGD